MSMPMVALDNGWIIKSSIWPYSHSFFLIYSKYTKQTIVRFFSEGREIEAYSFVDKITSKSARNIFPDEAYTTFENEEDQNDSE